MNRSVSGWKGIMPAALMVWAIACTTQAQPATQARESGGCFIGGCSGQVCSERKNIITTCEMRPEYTCYQQASCGRNADGKCSWQMTDTLRECLAKAKSQGNKLR